MLIPQLENAADYKHNDKISLVVYAIIHLAFIKENLYLLFYTFGNIKGWKRFNKQPTINVYL